MPGTKDVWRVTASLACIAVLAGCAGGPASAVGTGRPPETTAPTTSSHPVEAPLEMTAADEPDRAAQGTVTLEAGGTVSATASDGSAFELVVPPRAVAEQVTITMTPLREVSGVGSSGPIHAVRMAPDGLTFYRPVRLTIRPAGPIPVGHQLLFIASDDGTDLQLALIDPSSPPEAPVVLLEHFTAPAVGAFTPDEQASFKRKSALNAERRLSNEPKDRIQDQRDRSDDTPPDLADLLEEYQREVLDKLKEAAALSCDGLYLYVKKLLSFHKALELLGAAAADSYAGAVTEAARILAERYPECEREAIKKCTAAKDPGILITFWLRNTEVGYQQNVPVAKAMKAVAERRCRPNGDQFHFAGEGTGDYGYPAPIGYEYWGLRCPEAGVWQVWEMVAHEHGTESTGTPDAAIHGPILVMFNGAGRIARATYGPFGELPPGYLLHRTALSLAPPEEPTTVTAQISAGQIDVVVTDAVEPWDGSFGKCDEGG